MSLITVYLSSTVLLNEFTKLRPKIGEHVGIKYLGKADGDNAYHRYKVIVDREMNVDEFFGVAFVPNPVTPADTDGVNDVPF